MVILRPTLAVTDLPFALTRTRVTGVVTFVRTETQVTEI